MWPLLLTNWKVTLCATVLICLSAALSVQTYRVRSLRDDLATEQQAHAQTKALHQIAVESAKAKADEQRKTYERAAEAANERHQAILEQAKKDTAAAKALAARYLRSGNAACGLRLPTDMPAPNPAGAGTPEDTPRADGIPQPELRPLENVLATCDVDAKTVDNFQQWCRDNNCEVID